jgi:hypothetical protein
MASQLLWRDHIAWSDGQTSNGLHCWLGTHIRGRAYCPHAHSDKSSRRQLICRHQPEQCMPYGR